MSAADFFAAQSRETGMPARDSYERPVLVPRGAPPGTVASYMRASSFAERVEDHRHIYTWEKRYLAQAMGKNRDLADLAAGEEYVSSKLAPDVGANRASGKRLDSIIHRALDREGIHFLADRGTAYHSFCERRARLTEGSIPPEYLEGVKSYWDCVDSYGLQIGDVEIFVACDELMAAGTFDSLVWDPRVGLWRIGDIKTGDISLGYAVQEVIYDHSERYDPETHERSPLLTEEQAALGDLDMEVGLIFKVIPETVDKPARTELIEVDLVKAWNIALSIRNIMDDFNSDLFTTVAPPKRLTIADRIGQAVTIDEIKTVWSTHRSEWTADHAALANARRAELEG